MTLTMLLLAAAAQQPIPAVQPAVAQPKLVCKRIADTGSLVSHRKICYTRKDWDRIAAAARENSEFIQTQNTLRPIDGN